MNNLARSLLCGFLCLCTNTLGWPFAWQQWDSVKRTHTGLPSTTSLTPLRQMQTIWQRRWYLKGWNNLGACDRYKMKVLKMKTTIIKSILILESCCMHKNNVESQSKLLGDFILKTHFGGFMEGQLARTTFLARTTRKGLVAGGDYDKRQSRMIAENTDSRGGGCMSLDALVQCLCLTVLVYKWGWLGWGKDELR